MAKKLTDLFIKGGSKLLQGSMGSAPTITPVITTPNVPIVQPLVVVKKIPKKKSKKFKLQPVRWTWDDAPDIRATPVRVPVGRISTENKWEGKVGVSERLSTHDTSKVILSESRKSGKSYEEAIEGLIAYHEENKVRALTTYLAGVILCAQLKLVDKDTKFKMVGASVQAFSSDVADSHAAHVLKTFVLHKPGSTDGSLLDDILSKSEFTELLSLAITGKMGQITSIPSTFNLVGDGTTERAYGQKLSVAMENLLIKWYGRLFVNVSDYIEMQADIIAIVQDVHTISKSAISGAIKQKNMAIALGTFALQRQSYIISLKTVKEIEKNKRHVAALKVIEKTLNNLNYTQLGRDELRIMIMNTF